MQNLNWNQVSKNKFNKRSEKIQKQRKRENNHSSAIKQTQGLSDPPQGL